MEKIRGINFSEVKERWLSGEELSKDDIAGLIAIIEVQSERIRVISEMLRELDGIE